MQHRGIGISQLAFHIMKNLKTDLVYFIKSKIVYKQITIEKIEGKTCIILVLA
jgi:hypothetical protein